MPSRPNTKQKRSFFARIALIFLVIAVVLGSIPLALVALYARADSEPQSNLMMWRSATGQHVERTWVSLDSIAPAVWQSVISSEDGQFCSHRGVDWGALRGQVDAVLEGNPTRGASTIAMQTVKNTLLWSGRSYLRKVLEVPLAILIDRAWGKKRVMEIYLNIAEWGPGIYGIEAAAQAYFGRPASRLTRQQAARLAVVLPNPILRNPTRLTRTLGRVAKRVQRRASQSGGYTWCLTARD